MSLMYPDGDMTAKYIATLIKKHIVSFSGMNVDVVSDKNAGFAPAIHVGKTKRSTVTAESGKYNIKVTNAGLEIAVDDIFTYAAAYSTITNEVLAYSTPHIALTVGQEWSGDSIQDSNVARTTDVRIM